MIEVRGLAYTYEGADSPAVRGLDFTVEDGEVLGFLGPSGAGKSTTQNVLIGLLRGYTGSVSVLGRDLAGVGPDYYESIGVSFESPNHFLKLTARENLDYFRALYEGPTDEPEALMEMVGLSDVLDVRVAEYSKGMKHRLNFARSLLNRPKLWFLDEPTAGLDPVNARNVRDIIRDRQASGVTAFLTTHDMAVADDLSDRVAFIVDGTLELIDTPTRLKHQFGRRRLKIEYHEGDQTRQAEFDLDALSENEAFQTVLREHRIETMHSQETTLEQVFIEATGHRLQ
jgi:fluoroquinolone transport system ATP-binding protein